ncbi:MAG: arsenate reductase (azurin) small subunit [Candidatus Rokuibacteriota bacterium]
MATRREFLKAGGAGLGALVAAQAPATVIAGPASSYPVVTVAPFKSLARGAVIAFAYPDPQSPAVLIRLGGPALGGVGPGRDIVAYSTLCTHKGCPVGYRPERKLMICPCHWSTFDPAKAGALVIGQASQHLPQIELRIENEAVQAVGVSGLIYGRHTNIL